MDSPYSSKTSWFVANLCKLASSQWPWTYSGTVPRLPILEILHIYLPFKCYFHPKQIITIPIGSYFGMGLKPPTSQAHFYYCRYSWHMFVQKIQHLAAAGLAATEVSGDAALKLLKEPEVRRRWDAGWLVPIWGFLKMGDPQNVPSHHRFQYLNGLILDDLRVGTTPYFSLSIHTWDDPQLTHLFWGMKPLSWW
jgi:hypothetical protein